MSLNPNCRFLSLLTYYTHKKTKEKLNMTTLTISADAAVDNSVVILTRAYKVDATGEVKQGPITIRKSEVATVVPSNRLGKANHRSTVTLKSGAKFELADLYSEVVDAVFGQE